MQTIYTAVDAESGKVELVKGLEDAMSQLSLLVFYFVLFFGFVFFVQRTVKQKVEITRLQKENSSLKSLVQQQKCQQEERLQDLERECAAKDTKL